MNTLEADLAYIEDLRTAYRIVAAKAGVPTQPIQQAFDDLVAKLHAAHAEQRQSVVLQAERYAQQRAYIVPAAELAVEATTVLSDLGERGVPVAVLDTISRDLVATLTDETADQAVRRAALERLYARHDMWRRHVQDYRDWATRTSWALSATLFATALGCLYAIYRGAPIYVLMLAGASGALLSVLGKFPPMLGWGEWAGYTPRMLGRVMTALVTTLAGAAMLGSGVIQIGDIEFSKLVESTQRGQLLLLAGIGIAFGFSERLLVTFHELVFRTDERPTERALETGDVAKRPLGGSSSGLADVLTRLHDSNNALMEEETMVRDLYVTSPLLRGDDVLELQRKLGELGYAVGALDGVYGPTTASAVVTFQRTNGLEPDGWVGPDTRGALASPNVKSAPAPSDIGAKALARAEQELLLGISEEPAYSNKQKYGEWFGANGYAWCNMFVSYCFLEGAGYELCKDFPGSKDTGIWRGKGCAYVPTTERWLKSIGLWVGKVAPSPGDIAIFNWDGRESDHIGIVVKDLGNGRFECIEGNTRNSEQTNDCVRRTVRNLSQVDGFGRVR